MDFLASGINTKDSFTSTVTLQCPHFVLFFLSPAPPPLSERVVGMKTRRGVRSRKFVSDHYAGVRTKDFTNLHANQKFSWTRTVTNSFASDEDAILQAGILR